MVICIAVLCNVARAQDYIFATEDLITLKCADCELQGSITLPDSDSVTAIVLLLGGTGPTDRDGNQMMMRTNALKMLAYELAGNNIASVRFDKRGVGASRFQPVNTEDIRIDHFISDAKDWIAKLRKDYRFQKIILLGHDEGSLVALAAAANNRYVNAVISIGGTGRTMDQVFKDQYAHQPQPIREIVYDIIETLHSGSTVDHVPVYLSSSFTPVLQPFLISMMQYNPQEEARKIKAPFLVLQGERDVQVMREDARLLAAAHGKATLVTIPDMNHVMKDCYSMEEDEQFMTYVNPALPVNRQLVREVVTFIRGL